ncbi:MAG: hypothetical protein JNM55_23060 [Anaerolineales bacterium]|nr:hypothetical protein [Anaerolineales bacterium]
MTNKLYPTDLHDQANSLLTAWNQIDGTQAFGDLTPAVLSAELTEAVSIRSQMDALETQITNLRNQYHSKNQSIWDKVKRVRSSVKGIYGDDSSQYEMVGGTRLSERKPPKRKAGPAA